MVPCPVCHGRVCFQHPSFSISQSLAHHTTRNAWPSPVSHLPSPKRKKTSQKDHNKCNLLFVQGLKTCMFTCLSVAWGALSYIGPPHYKKCLAWPSPASHLPSSKRKKTSQKDHNKCNLLFVQGLKTCMFTCLSVT